MSITLIGTLFSFTYRNAGVRIGPEYVAQESGIRYITGSGNVGDLFHLRKFRAESSVHANDFIVNDGRARQAVESVAELLPHLDGIPATAFVVESVNSVNACTFVVPAEEEKVFWVLDFVSEQ